MFGPGHTKKFDEAIKKAELFGADVEKKICTTISHIGKLNITSFVNATSSLTDLQFSIEAVQDFFAKFSKCINLQEITSESVISRLEVTLSQLETRVLPLFSKINGTGPGISAVFGANNGVVISGSLESMNASLQISFQKLRSIRYNISNATANGIVIDKDNLKRYYREVDVEELAKSIDEYVKSAQLLVNLINGFSSVAEIVGSVTSEIQKSKYEASLSLKKSSQEFDLTIVSVKTRNNLRNEENVMYIVQKIDGFFQLISRKYYDNPKVTQYRDTLEFITSKLTMGLMNMSISYEKLIKEFDTKVKSLEISLNTNLTASIKNVTEFYATKTALRGQSSVACLFPKSDGETAAKKLVQDHVNRIGKCYGKQSLAALQTQSFSTFLQEDVVLNYRGHIDRLCGCVDVGDLTVTEQTINCLNKVIIPIKIQILEFKFKFNFFPVKTLAELKKDAEKDVGMIPEPPAANSTATATNGTAPMTGTLPLGTRQIASRSTNTTTTTTVPTNTTAASNSSAPAVVPYLISGFTNVTQIITKSSIELTTCTEESQKSFDKEFLKIQVDILACLAN